MAKKRNTKSTTSKKRRYKTQNSKKVHLLGVRADGTEYTDYQKLFYSLPLTTQTLSTIEKRTRTYIKYLLSKKNLRRRNIRAMFRVFRIQNKKKLFFSVSSQTMQRSDKDIVITTILDLLREFLEGSGSGDIGTHRYFMHSLRVIFYKK